MAPTSLTVKAAMPHFPLQLPGSLLLTVRLKGGNFLSVGPVPNS